MKKSRNVITGIIAIIALAVIAEYAIFFLILAAIAAIACVVYAISKRRKAKRQKEIGDEAYRLAMEKVRQEEAERDRQLKERAAQLALERQNREAERIEEMNRIQQEVDARIQRFCAEIDAIPRVEIVESAPAPKQYLKDMPEYGFSNITAKTKTAAIFPLVVLDVETTGLYPSDCEIVEVSAIKFDAGMVPVECFTTLCKPKKPIPAQATAINHITDEMVADSPNFRQIAPALSEFIAGCNLLGYNLDFDLRFIHVHGAKIPFEKKLYDGLELAQRTIKRSDIANHKLQTLCSWYGIYRSDAHSSLSDCYATAKVFINLVFDKTSRNLEAEPGA